MEKMRPVPRSDLVYVKQIKYATKLLQMSPYKSLFEKKCTLDASTIARLNASLSDRDARRKEVYEMMLLRWKIIGGVAGVLHKQYSLPEGLSVDLAKSSLQKKAVGSIIEQGFTEADLFRSIDNAARTLYLRLKEEIQKN
jgi:hypothetical protein